MPRKPQVKKLTASSADILNVIRANASADYRDYIPEADPESLDSIREIGTVLMDYPKLQNEFLNALINRIGRVVVTSKMYEDPLGAIFGKGLLSNGESVEEIFVQIAKPFEYDQDAEGKMLKREIPDVRAAFHVMNYRKFYKVTVEEEQLRQAFLSWDGVTDLIARITDSLYSGAAYDRYLIVKYLLAKKILNGQMYPVNVTTGDTDADLKKDAATFRATSNKLNFMSDKYNLAHVTTFCKTPDQYILMNAAYEGRFSVDVLAYAFNMDKADVLAHLVMIDGFDDMNGDRIKQLFTDQEGKPIGNYEPFTDEQIKALDAIPAILIDKDFLMLFDVTDKFTDFYNGESLSFNYWYHRWGVVSSSPFADAIVFTPAIPAVNSVTISPATASITAGQPVQFSATVDTVGFAPKSVKYSLSGDGADKATIDIYGNLQTAEDATGTITVTATSTYDDTKTAEATVTVQP